MYSQTAQTEAAFRTEQTRRKNVISLYVCNSRWIVAAHLARSQVARCHTGQSAAVRQSRQSGRQGVRLPHARPASRAPLADARTRHDNCVQYLCDTDRVLQFSTVRCISSDVRCTSVCSKHSCPCGNTRVRDAAALRRPFGTHCRTMSSTRTP